MEWITNLWSAKLNNSFLHRFQVHLTNEWHTCFQATSRNSCRKNKEIIEASLYIALRKLMVMHNNIFKTFQHIKQIECFITRMQNWTFFFSVEDCLVNKGHYLNNLLLRWCYWIVCSFEGEKQFFSINNKSLLYAFFFCFSTFKQEPN